MILKHNDAQCAVECQVRVKCKSKKLVKGWKAFADDNDLTIGDLCMLELQWYDSNIMIIHIARSQVHKVNNSFPKVSSSIPM